MKDNYTDIYVILDKSGSMGSIVNDTIVGFNTFLEDQKAQRGEATLTLVKFNSIVEVELDCVPLSEASDLTNQNYRPGGGTALYDAIGQTINNAGNRIVTLDEDERPSKVIMVIITDGEENTSQGFRNVDDIMSMISHQRESYAWEFVFLGANQDAMVASRSLGIASNRTMSYAASGSGTRHMFHSMSDGMTSYRSVASVQDFSNQDYFSEEARNVQESLINDKAPKLDESPETEIEDDTKGEKSTNLVI